MPRLCGGYTEAREEQSPAREEESPSRREESPSREEQSEAQVIGEKQTNNLTSVWLMLMVDFWNGELSFVYEDMGNLSVLKKNLNVKNSSHGYFFFKVLPKFGRMFVYLFFWIVATLFNQNICNFGMTFLL